MDDPLPDDPELLDEGIIKAEPLANSGGSEGGLPSDDVLPTSLIMSVCKDGSVVSTNDNYRGFSQVDFVPSAERIALKASKASGSVLRRLMRKYVCNHCNYSTAFKVSMHVHSEKHLNPKNFKVSCSYCDASMNSHNEHELHVTSSHPGVKLYKCETCAYSTNYRWALNRHTLSVHDTGKPTAETFKCDICPYKSCYRPALYSHMKKVHNTKDPYPCKKCDKSFKSVLKLRQHNLAKHDRDNLFKCDSCDYICQSSTGISTHMSKKHKVDIIDEINSSMMTLT